MWCCTLKAWLIRPGFLTKVSLICICAIVLLKIARYGSIGPNRSDTALYAGPCFANTPATTVRTEFVFDNTYARRLEGLYVPWQAVQVPEPRLVKLNHALAEELGLDAQALDSAEGALIFSGSQLPPGK